MVNYVYTYPHTVPLSIKLFCSFFIWFPILIPFVTLWYFPSLTIIYNFLVSIYTVIFFCLTYFTSFFVCFKQKQIISKFFQTSHWIRLRKTFQQKQQSTIEDILHIVIIPIYKEDLTILDTTLRSLSRQNVSMLIGLALEEREVNSNTKYDPIIDKYQGQFLSIIKTIHPMGLPNEIPGKASNCNHCLPILIEYYEEHYKSTYPHAMMTSCDCDTIWCEDYFLYLNYLCTQNGLKSFNRTTYVPIVSNLENFEDNHVVSNCMAIVRSVVTHGHFRRLGMVRVFVSEYHVPIDLMKKIDFWDGDLVHEDAHTWNKLAILENETVLFKQTYLPCDNQTPTDTNSAYRSLVLLWNQSLRWNLFTYDIYYLFHLLLMNIFEKKSYKTFRASSWKIIKELVNNYENFFYFYIAPVSNQIFWIYYFCVFDHQSFSYLTNFLVNYIQPWFFFIQVLLVISYTFLIFYSACETTKLKLYSWKKSILFATAIVPFYFFTVVYQTLNVTIAWIHTLRSWNTHAESARKIVSNCKDK